MIPDRVLLGAWYVTKRTFALTKALRTYAEDLERRIAALEARLDKH